MAGRASSSGLLSLLHSLLPLLPLLPLPSTSWASLSSTRWGGEEEGEARKEAGEPREPMGDSRGDLTDLTDSVEERGDGVAWGGSVYPQIGSDPFSYSNSPEILTRPVWAWLLYF